MRQPLSIVEAMPLKKLYTYAKLAAAMTGKEFV